MPKNTFMQRRQGAKAALLETTLRALAPLREAWLALALACSLPACKTIQLPVEPPTQPQIADIQSRYNDRAARVQQFWARTDIQLRWTDSRGKKHSENGDGKLILRKPADLALTVGRLNEVYYWLGCDNHSFWWIDRNPHDDPPDAAYFGRLADFPTFTARRIGIPIRPDQFVQLLGLGELPAGGLRLLSGRPEKAAGGVGFWFSAPTPSPEQTVRLLIDPQTARPLKVQITDAAGLVVADSTLADYRPMRTKNAPPAPELPTRIEIESPAQKVRLKISLADATADKVADPQFDFNAIVNQYDLGGAVRIVKPQ